MMDRLFKRDKEICRICNKEFDSLKDLNKHYSNWHE